MGIVLAPEHARYHLRIGSSLILTMFITDVVKNAVGRPKAR